MLDSQTSTPFVILAPMAGYSDAPMREIVSQFGVDAVVSEMMACAEWKTGKQGVAERVRRGNLHSDTKYIVQIAGRDPKLLGEAARFAEAQGADQIDINMGCPAKKVVSGATAGASLLLEPKLACAIIESVAQAVSTPVSVKTRLGWDEYSTKILIHDFEEAGAQMLTIHGRTRQQKYRGQADWKAVGEICQIARVPVIVNGDITNISTAKEALKQSNARGLMIGRGAIGCPDIPSKIRSQIGGHMPQKKWNYDFISMHYEAILNHYGIEFGVQNARKHLKAYFSNASRHWLKSLLSETDHIKVFQMIGKKGICRMIDEILSFPQIIYIGLDKDYKIKDLSPSAEQYLGNSIARLRGKSIREVLPDSHPIIVNAKHEGQVSLFDQKFYMLNATTERFDIHQSKSDDQINILLYPKPNRMDKNLTEAARGALRQASGMAALLSHEIRNPLSAIKGASQLLAMNAKSDDIDLIQVIEEESARIGRMINDFEEMAGDAPAVKQPVNIHLILYQSMRAARAGYAREIDFYESYDPSLPEIAADPDRLQRALSNIIKNASEAIAGRFGSAMHQGRISITTRYRRGLKRGRLGVPVELTISDNGGGIDESLLNDAFKPFVTTKTNGTGLGLSVVARIVEEIGGVIEVSNVNHGCEIRMLFPIWRDKWTEQ